VSCTPPHREIHSSRCAPRSRHSSCHQAAATIFRRFEDLFRPTASRPQIVMTLTDDEIRACGFSRPKVSFIKDPASHVLDGRLDLKGLKKHPDDEVMRQLVVVKGIGRWTAEIFLMFRLGRPDILPPTIWD
jgi:DNA-3-methyladenine glycosylase II